MTWRVYGRVRGIWIRIRHIPLVYFTIDTMYALAKEIGKVEEIAYDPKVSQTKDYIRARITFNVDNPAKVTRKLNVESSDPVTIEFEYEKIHKRCFHCFRLTHEKIRCPHLRKGFFKEKPHTLETQLLRGAKNFKINKWLYSTSPMLMKLRGMQEFKVRKGIAEEAADSAFRLTKITNDLSKGKGHIVDYLDPAVTTPS
ncbi:hypothetical protein Bca101_031150 [Brassica carinata]